MENGLQKKKKTLLKGKGQSDTNIGTSAKPAQRSRTGQGKSMNPLGPLLLPPQRCSINGLPPAADRGGRYLSSKNIKTSFKLRLCFCQQCMQKGTPPAPAPWTGSGHLTMYAGLIFENISLQDNFPASLPGEVYVQLFLALEKLQYLLNILVHLKVGLRSRWYIRCAPG